MTAGTERRNARILVVDDSPEILSIVQRGLQRRGYEVVACADGESTLKAFSREIFDLVVLDSPPIVPIPDPAILSGLADGVVLVLQAGHTPRRLIDRALDRLHGAVLLGFVLNRTDEFRYYADYYQYDYGA